MNNSIGKILLIALLFSLLFSLAACSGPAQTQQRGGDNTVSPTPVGGENSYFSQEEILQNQTQTNNIVITGIILVIIVFGGTFSVIWRRK